MIVLFALSLTMVACDNGTTGGGTDNSGGVSVAKEYWGVYKVRYDTAGWRLEVKEKTLEVQKGTTGAVKIIPVTSAQKKDQYYSIGVSSVLS